mgnify:CR=1 FL=1
MFVPQSALAEDFNAVRDLFIEREGNVGKASLLDAATPCLLITLDYEQRQMNGPPFAVSA